MTAPLPPNADELVSAYVDGDAAPDEMAIVEAHPELMARVDELRDMLDLIAAPQGPGPAPAVKQNHLAAALGEFDRLVAAGEFGPGADDAQGAAEIGGPADAVGGGGAGEGSAPVVSLAEARERRRPRRLNMVAAAAAAVALLFAGIVAVGINRGGDTAEVVGSASDAVEGSAAFEITESDAMADSAEAADDALADDASDEEELFAAAAEAAPEPAMLDEAADDDMAVGDDVGDAARAEPAPTPPVAGSAPSQEAANDAGADAEAEFADDADAIDDADAADDLPDFAVLELGEFVTIEELERGLIERYGDPASALDDVTEALGDPRVLASTCDLAEFGLVPGRIVGFGDVGNSFFEAHVDPAGTTFVVIGIEQPGSCVELARFEN